MSVINKKQIFHPFKEDPSFKDQGDAFWKTVLFLSPVGFIFASFYYFWWSAPIAATVTLCHTIAFLMMLFFRRFSPEHRLWIHLGIVIYLSLFAFLSLVTGGYKSINLWWLITTPVVAGNFLNRKEILLWAFLATAMTIALFCPFVHAFSFLEITEEKMKYVKLASVFSLTIVFTTTAYFSEKARREAQEKEKEALKLANRNSNLASLGEMAGGIAHEINNPLMIISGSARVVEKSIRKDNFEKEEVLQHLDTISNSTQRASKIIKGLKTLARDGFADPKEKVLLRDAFDDVMVFMGSNFAINDIELKFDKANPLLNQEVMIHRVQFSQIILNLLGNSIDAIKELEQKWVKIEITENEKDLVMQFVDSGKGIPKEIADKIFTPFFTTKPVGKGTGLGLSLCHSIILAMGGRLEYGLIGGHTSFILSLPKIDNQKKSA